MPTIRYALDIPQNQEVHYEYMAARAFVQSKTIRYAARRNIPHSVYRKQDIKRIFGCYNLLFGVDLLHAVYVERYGYRELTAYMLVPCLHVGVIVHYSLQTLQPAS